MPNRNLLLGVSFSICSLLIFVGFNSSLSLKAVSYWNLTVELLVVVAKSRSIFTTIGCWLSRRRRSNLSLL